MAGKILLAEDDSTLRDTLAEALRAEGYEVIPAANGQAAMDALDQPDAAQVIILDGLLPKVNGFDVAKFVRARGLDTPIIFMSGVFKSQDQQKDARDKYGAKAYLTKPFDTKRLVDAVAPLLAASSAAAAAASQQPLPAEGTTVECPVMYVLWRAAKEVHTGVLELYGDRERARVFVFKGRGVFGQHSDPQLNVGVELIRDGVIDATVYKQAAELAMQRGAGLYEVMKAEGWVTDAQAKPAYKLLLPKVIERVAAFNGRFRWVATDQFSNLIPASASPIIEPLLAGLRKTTERELDPHVTPRRPLRLAPGDNWGEVASRLIEGCGSDTLVKAINGRATIAQIIEASGNANERNARFRQIYLLMSTMAVKASLEVIPMAAAASVPAQAAPASAGPEPRAPASLDPPVAGGGAPPRPMSSGGAVGAKQASRPVIDQNADQGVMFSAEEDEARARIDAKFDEIEGKDHFAMLGVKRGADAAAVKKAYFALAKDFHTDAFAGINLGGAQKKLDHIFQSIQTAYATLTDEKKRGEYEAKLKFEDDGSSTDVAAILAAEGEMHKAKLLVERGELSSALKIIDKVVLVMPKNDEVLGYQRYCNWWQTKNPTTALETCRALEVHFKAQPGSLSLKEFQGWVYMEANDTKGAKNAFRKVLELDPKHPGATRGMRQLQRKIEEDEKKASSGLGKFLKR